MRVQQLGRLLLCANVVAASQSQLWLTPSLFRFCLDEVGNLVFGVCCWHQVRSWAMVDVDGFVSVASSSSMQPELWCQLPAEIQYQVLLRLPVVELLRFASVCKQWRKWTTSADFRRRCLNPRAGPYLLAIRSLYDLRFAPVLSSDGSNWHGLDLTFLYNALIKKNCVQILSASSDGGLLCVGAVRAHQDPLEKYVILVCNPLTKSWKCLPQ